MHFAVNTRLLIPEKMDGIGRFTYETLLRITTKHPEIQFTFLFDRHINLKSFNFPTNVKPVVLSPQARHPLLWILWFEWKLKNYLNRHSFDLFLSPEGWIPPGLRCKSLGVIHDLNFEHHPENIIYSHRTFLTHFSPRFAKRANRIATVSRFTKEDIINTYRVNPEKIDVVYNGANKVFSAISASQKEKIKKQYSNGEDYFIFIGTLHPRKNLSHLFQAFEQFKQKTSSSMKLLVAGNRKWWPKSLEYIYRNSSAKEDIIFLGRMTDEDLAMVLGAAFCLTYLPYFEGFGIPILEAFQSKVPVITSNVTSMPEVAGEAALFCVPDNIAQIAETMERIVQDDNKRNELIEKGSQRAEDFSWDRTANLLWNSIQHCLK